MNEKTGQSMGIARRTLVGCAVLLLLLAAAVVLSLAVGAENVPIGDSARVIAGHVGIGDRSTLDPLKDTIVWNIRIPRILLAVIVGILLASSGVALQGLLLNPLADPYTVGVSSGASLGAAVAFVFGLGSWFYGFGVPVSAFLFAIGAMMVVYTIARVAGRVSIHSFLLAGIVVGSFLWALLTFVMTISGQEVSRIIFWLLGSFQAPYASNPWDYVTMALPFAVVGMAALYALARDLNVFALGEETARHLGIETESLKFLVIAVTSLITAAAVSVSGIIGFVGLVVPHICRRVFGSDHRVLLPCSALAGAVLLVVADTVARALGELPVGVVTAMIGAPFFLYLMRRQG
jgi:iron complex transport system permease protein